MNARAESAGQIDSQPVTPAPIALFAYNRPAFVRRTLSALASNKLASRSLLYVFIDGPRGKADSLAVGEVIRVCENATGFERVVLHVEEHNIGLFQSITSGVSNVIARHGKIIVVEDDIVPCSMFLDYANDMLERYRTNSKIGSIHGYAPPICGLPDYYFLAGGDCWGWATWSDRWNFFDADAKGLVRRIIDSGQFSDFCNTQGFRSLLMLCQRALGRNGSWALPWHASLFLKGYLTLHPGKSFVTNIGNDGSGEHSANSRRYDTELRTNYEGVPVLAVERDAAAGRALSLFNDCGKSLGTRPAAQRFLLKCYVWLLAHFVAKSPTVGREIHD